MKLKDVLKFLFEKQRYDMVNNADSMHSRMSAGRSGGKGLSGGRIQKVIDAEDEEKGTTSTKTPSKMMDIVLQTWTGDTPEPGDDDES